jgi:low temperature requirement protein LtrA
MTSRAAALLRGPEDPGRATFLELFFDLVFVFALFRLSQELLEHLTWSGALQTLVLLLALMSLWGSTAWVADRFDPNRPAIQALVIGCMFGSLMLAAAAPEAFGARGLAFAVAYVASQVGRTLVLVVVTRGGKRQRLELRQFLWYGVSALPWLAGAAAHGWARVVLWAVAGTMGWAAFGFGYPMPGMRRMKPKELGIFGELYAERNRQFFIIALGEVILASGLAFNSLGFGPVRIAAVVAVFATTVLLWRIYIYRAGEVFGAAVVVAAQQRHVMVAQIYAHVVMVAGVVAISAGGELVIMHGSGDNEPAWVVVTLGGPALFLAGRAIFEYTVFERVSRDRAIGVFVLAAISPAMISVPLLIVAITAAVVLAGVAVADSISTRRHPAEPPSPPGGPS